MTDSKWYQDLLDRTDIPLDVKEKILKGVVYTKKLESELDNSDYEFDGNQPEIPELLKMVMNNIPNEVFWKNLDSVYLGCNQNYSKSLGLNSPEEIVGKTEYDFHYKDEEIQSFIKSDRYAISSNKPNVNNVVQVNRIDGTIGTYLINKVPLHNRRNQVIGILGTSIDITDTIELKNKLKQTIDELEEAEARYKLLVTNTEEGVWVTDKHDVTLYVNPALCNILGYSESELVGTKVTNYISVDSSEIFHRIRNDRFIYEVSSSSYELTFLTKEGNEVITRVSGTLLKNDNDEPIGSFGILTDITKEKLAQEALIRTKYEEEQYHALLSHFIFNDLQKIVSIVEFLSIKGETDPNIDKFNLLKIKDIALHSSDTISRVNKIFNILQIKNGIELESDSSFIEALKNAIAQIEKIKFSSLSVHLDESLLNKYFIKQKIFLEDAFFEIISFLIYDKLDKIVYISGIETADSLIISISDKESNPLSEDVCQRLYSSINENWEYTGHYLPVNLVSVILDQLYGGKLEIIPDNNSGNEFQFHFPKKLITSKELLFSH